MSENKALKLIVFSDVHYGPKELGYGYYEDKRKLTEYALPLTHQLIQIVNEMKPDMVAYLGDFIQETGSLDADKLNFKKIWNEFSKFSVPFYAVPGNHDLITLSVQDIKEIMGYE